MSHVSIHLMDQFKKGDTYHFIWLLGSKLYETFPVINMDGDGCETHEGGSINTTQAYILKGAITSKQALSLFHKIKLGLISKRRGFHSLVSIPMLWSKLMIITRPCSIKSKLTIHPVANTWGVTALPSPRDSVQKTFKGREACHPFSNISDSIRLLSSEHHI
jgi:hypothetical protein